MEINIFSRRVLDCFLFTFYIAHCGVRNMVRMSFFLGLYQNNVIRMAIQRQFLLKPLEIAFVRRVVWNDKGVLVAQRADYS